MELTMKKKSALDLEIRMAFDIVLAEHGIALRYESEALSAVNHAAEDPYLLDEGAEPAIYEWDENQTLVRKDGEPLREKDYDLIARRIADQAAKYIDFK